MAVLPRLFGGPQSYLANEEVSGGSTTKAAEDEGLAPPSGGVPVSKTNYPPRPLTPPLTRLFTWFGWARSGFSLVSSPERTGSQLHTDTHIHSEKHAHTHSQQPKQRQCRDAIRPRRHSEHLALILVLFNPRGGGGGVYSVSASSEALAGDTEPTCCSLRVDTSISFPTGNSL